MEQNGKDGWMDGNGGGVVSTPVGAFAFVGSPDADASSLLSVCCSWHQTMP